MPLSTGHSGVARTSVKVAGPVGQRFPESKDIGLEILKQWQHMDNPKAWPPELKQSSQMALITLDQESASPNTTQDVSALVLA